MLQANGLTFTYPELFSKEVEDEKEKKQKEQIDEFKKFYEQINARDNKEHRKNIPSWFGI